MAYLDNVESFNAEGVPKDTRVSGLVTTVLQPARVTKSGLRLIPVEIELIDNTYIRTADLIEAVSCE